MPKYKSFDLLKKLYFVRTSATEEELKAANIIRDEVESLGVKAWLEEFDVNHPYIKNACVKFHNPDFAPECVGVGMSGSTPEEGLTGELVYIENEETANVTDVKDKIVLVHSKIIPQKLYKMLVEKEAKGIIECCGDVYRPTSDVDLDPYAYRERNYKFGKIPAVCIRFKDAEKILNAAPKSATIVNIEEEAVAKSHNVVAEIKGTELPDEVIAFTAHYDSVPFSKGIYDNATGSTTIMQMLAYYVKNPPKRTLRFIWCGSEEIGLEGSKAYVAAHKEEVEKNYKLNINVDMTGVTIGFDLACVTGPQSLVDNISYYGKEIGFAIKTRQGVYSSDSSPFADVGIPAISFARLAPTGGAQIHSHRDVIERLNATPYYKTCDFIASISSKWINSVCFPVPKEMPDNMKTELDYYFFRKERP
ncbi:MAG: M28 family peptidase [Bacilli bacterium]|nr:M28 family peptidase [Bacilli bacterium]